MNSGDMQVGTDKVDNAFWENILQNFNNTETITDFQTLQNIANQVSYIHPEKCILEYGKTEYNGSVDRSKMPNSGNKYPDDNQRLNIFQQTVNNYRHIWNKLDNREKNFVYTCVCGGYVDTLGLFFLNRLQRNKMVESQDKHLDNLLIDIDNAYLTNFPDPHYFSNSYYEQYQNNDLNYDFNQNDNFPTLENYVEKQFEKCKRIHRKVQSKIGRDKSKNNQLNKLWEDLVEKKNCGNCDEMLSLCEEIKKLIY